MPRLVIVSVNDVYALDNLPRLATMIAHYRREPADAVIFPLAGDFLAPSLLSSIDAGRGMVDCINAIGITHVVLGNHEDDIPPEELRARLEELEPPCLGTNVLTGLDLPRHLVIDVGPLKVGLVGVVMDDPAVYHGKPFGGALLARANDAAIAETAQLLRNGCAAVIPITHQAIADDRALAERQREPPYPVIVGGHEHTPMLVEHHGTWIVKAGAEAVQAVVTDVVWPDGGGAPAVTTRLEAVALYEEDPAVRARVDAHMEQVRELATATLLYLEPGQSLSSVGTRVRQTSIGTLICSRLRDCLGAQACLFNGGGIRASREYTTRITYGDIEAEVPFDNEIVVVPLPGRVLAAGVKASRARAPAEWGAFLQVDDRMKLTESNDVAEVDGAPLDPERLYDVALVREILVGLDHIEPLVTWARENPALVPPADSGREPKVLLVQAFALAVWRSLGGFDVLDADRDDKVTPAEIAAAVERRHPSQGPSKVLADLIVQAIDLDADRIVSRADAAQAGCTSAKRR
ncbi:MAG: 5'-nucleotidase C-terminal domain-containing protein [Labilithrix sp.]|nr:5'-nucleotidase C-terminal domain-containing protein [Labilithrix sp.]MCW5817546.1 5'-nucleotidase C-terminal domain-containing protein [Labilithrix sp.]